MDFGSLPLIKETVLDRLTFANKTTITNAAREFIAPDNLEVIAKHCPEGMVIELKARIAAEKLDMLDYPSDWWQAFKERWFPPWAKKRWHVEYRHFDGYALYPKISLPREQHHLHVIERR
jgi:hypothetical protein